MKLLQNEIKSTKRFIEFIQWMVYEKGLGELAIIDAVEQSKFPRKSMQLLFDEFNDQYEKEGKAFELMEKIDIWNDFIEKSTLNDRRQVADPDCIICDGDGIHTEQETQYDGDDIIIIDIPNDCECIWNRSDQVVEYWKSKGRAS